MKESVLFELQMNFTEKGREKITFKLNYQQDSEILDLGQMTTVRRRKLCHVLTALIPKVNPNSII